MEASLTRPVASFLAALLLAAPGGAGGLTAKEKVLWDGLRARIEAVDRSLDGVLGVSVRDLETGTAIELRAEELFPAASTIKLAILYELFLEAEEGRVDLAELTRPPGPRVGGSGVRQRLGGSVSLTWRDLAVLMIGWSDNEAANLIAGPARDGSGEPAAGRPGPRPDTPPPAHDGPRGRPRRSTGSPARASTGGEIPHRARGGLRRPPLEPPLAPPR